MNTEPVSFTLTRENMYMARIHPLFQPEITVPAEFEYKGTAYRVTGIGAGAFSGYESVEEIILPDTVTSIGVGAFQDCRSLETAVLPAGLTGLGRNTFENCSSLKEIILPEGMTDIGSCAFAGCTALERVLAPDSIKHVWSHAFSGCTALSYIILPEQADVDADAFLGCPHFEKKEWFIAIANSATADPVFMHFSGTADEARKAIFNLAAEDRNSDREGYSHGADDIRDVGRTEDGRKFTVSVIYQDYHVDYAIMEDSRIEELSRDILTWEVPPLKQEQCAGVYAKNLRFEKLKEALLAEGTDAVVDFLGWSYDPSHEDWELENDMDSVYAQMPEEELEAFYQEYDIPEQDTEPEEEEEEER